MVPIEQVSSRHRSKKDKDSLKRALQHTHGIVFFVASEKKALKLKEQLSTDGIGESDINRIVSPAGLEISAETTDEIVVSILAGLVKERRKPQLVIADMTEQVA